MSSVDVPRERRAIAEDSIAGPILAAVESAVGRDDGQQSRFEGGRERDSTGFPISRPFVGLVGTFAIRGALVVGRNTERSSPGVQTDIGSDARGSGPGGTSTALPDADPSASTRGLWPGWTSRAATAPGGGSNGR